MLTHVNIGDTVWFNLCRDIWQSPIILHGTVEQICEISGNVALVSTPSRGRTFHVREVRDLWQTRKDLAQYLKTLRQVKVGDLITYVHEDWPAAGGYEEKLMIGTCVKLTKKFAYIVSELGRKRVLRGLCIVLRQADSKKIEISSSATPA